MIPELARCAAAGSQERIRYLVKRGLRVALIYGCCFCGLEYLLADYLCNTLYSSTEAGNYLRLYALLIPMLYCDALTDAMTKGLGQQKVCVRYNIITSSMDVAFLYLLLPRYGMMGYFFSFLVTHLLNFTLSLRRLIKIVGNVLSLSGAIMTILGTGIAIYGATFVSQPFFRGGCFLILFVCLLFLLKVINKEDIAWIRGLVTKK